MKRSRIPEFVLERLDELEQAAEQLTQSVAETEEAIVRARARLTGTFQKRNEAAYVAASIKQLVEDLPEIRQKQGHSEYMLRT